MYKYSQANNNEQTEIKNYLQEKFINNRTTTEYLKFLVTKYNILLIQSYGQQEGNGDHKRRCCDVS